jgi:hypothetical protein
MRATTGAGEKEIAAAYATTIERKTRDIAIFARIHRGEALQQCRQAEGIIC